MACLALCLGCDPPPPNTADANPPESPFVPLGGRTLMEAGDLTPGLTLRVSSECDGTAVHRVGETQVIEHGAVDGWSAVSIRPVEPPATDLYDLTDDPWRFVTVRSRCPAEAIGFRISLLDRHLAIGAEPATRVLRGHTAQVTVPCTGRFDTHSVALDDLLASGCEGLPVIDPTDLDSVVTFGQLGRGARRIEIRDVALTRAAIGPALGARRFEAPHPSRCAADISRCVEGEAPLFTTGRWAESATACSERPIRLQVSEDDGLDRHAMLRPMCHGSCPGVPDPETAPVTPLWAAWNPATTWGVVYLTAGPPASSAAERAERALDLGSFSALRVVLAGAPGATIEVGLEDTRMRGSASGARVSLDLPPSGHDEFCIGLDAFPGAERASIYVPLALVFGGGTADAICLGDITLSRVPCKESASVPRADDEGA